MADSSLLPILLDVLSPESSILHQNVICVEFPGTLGRFEVLRNHAPLISSLERGEIRYMVDEGKWESLPISSGFVEICDNKITACVEL